jgi:hypothetical protein
LKTRTLFFLFFALLISTGTVSGQKRSYYDVADSIQIWMETRVANAAEGHPENVEMPLAVRSIGWGCRCPDHYIGVNPNVQEGPFVALLGTETFPRSDQNGHSLIVTGYFTGKWTEIDLRDETGEPAEWLYRVPEFTIRSWKINKKPEETKAPRILRK